MFLIQSERLRLIPLTYDQLMVLARSRNELEKLLSLKPSCFELNADPSFLDELAKAIYHYMLPKVAANPGNHEWYTHWLIVDRQRNLTVGGIGGTGRPDENGQVMIGYYVDKKFEQRGYATEAVKLFIQWMEANKALKSVVADTLVTGLGSQQVLRKNGFVLSGETDEGLRWKLTL